MRGFTASNVVPGVENFSIGGFNTSHSSIQRDCYRLRVDHSFFSEYQIEILEGRGFIKDLASDSNAVLLNEVAVRLFGFKSYEDAISQILNPEGYKLKVIGVIKNYHHSSLKEALDPIVFFYRPRAGNFFSIKMQAENVAETVSKVEDIWDELYPDNPFDSFFLEDHFNRQYKADEQFNTVFSAFAGLAIFVACLGLFGLVSFTAEQSRKEIGIRKVLGASIDKIILLFAKDYLLLLGISLVVAFPIAYWTMERWLNDFPYRTSISVWIFLAGGALIVGVALLTVSFKSVDAARSNPVEALRDE